MATFFRNQVIKEIGTVPVTVLATGSSSQLTIIGLSLSNLTVVPVNVNITIVDNASVEAYYLKDVVVPANASIRAVLSGEKLILPADYSIKIWTDETAALDAVISYVELT
jgi:hypothetical protein